MDKNFNNTEKKIKIPEGSRGKLKQVKWECKDGKTALVIQAPFTAQSGV